MWSLTPIQQLRRLDKSSPRFQGQLLGVLRTKKYKVCIDGLRDDDLSWLAEFLDDVVGTLQPSEPAFRACLHELRELCGRRRTLLPSHLLPLSLLNVVEQPTALCGHFSAHEGSFDGSKVTVKRLRIYSMEEPKDAKRDFFREVVIWKRLAHRNIVPFLGATIAPLQAVSASISGGDLLEHINTYPDADRLGLLSDVADGLGYLHSQNVIHGDLKGASILVDGAGCALLTDFGFSRVASDTGSITSVVNGYGARWAAPEVLDMEWPASEASDVYSFAMVAIEVFTGRVPFPNNKLTVVILVVLSGRRPERPTDPKLTDDIWKLTEQCWDHDRRRRPKMSQVVLRLRAASPPPYDRQSLDDATLASFEQKRRSLGMLTTAFSGFRRFWRSDTAYNTSSEEPKLSNSQNPPREDHDSVSEIEPNFKCDRYSWGKQEEVPEEGYVHSTPSQAGNCSLSLKQFFS